MYYKYNINIFLSQNALFLNTKILALQIKCLTLQRAVVYFSHDNDYVYACYYVIKLGIINNIM